MDDASDEEILGVYGAVVFSEEGFGRGVIGFEWAAGLFFFVAPVEGFVIAEVEAGAVVPFLAVTAFPTQLCEVVEGDGGVGVADEGALVATGTEQDYLAEIIGDVVPSVVAGAEGFAGVAPGVGPGIFFGGIVAVEAQAEGFALEVGADEGFGGFSVGGALDGVGHERIFAGCGVKVNWG